MVSIISSLYHWGSLFTAVVSSVCIQFYCIVVLCGPLGLQDESELVFFPCAQVNVRVTTMDAELEFAIQPSTTGKQLFDQVHRKYTNQWFCAVLFA